MASRRQGYGTQFCLARTALCLKTITFTSVAHVKRQRDNTGTLDSILNRLFYMHKYFTTVTMVACILRARIVYLYLSSDSLCGIVVTVPGCRSWGPLFDCRRYHIFWEVVGLERGLLSLVSTTEELLERKISASGLEKRILCGYYATLL
jgi:hypothetical protein